VYVCIQASAKNLVSPEHVWILPAYYERNWWKENSLNNGEDGCSNSMMEEILESVIFVNAIKIPPMVRY
jgi:hypothetical protein